MAILESILGITNSVFKNFTPEERKRRLKEKKEVGEKRMRLHSPIKFIQVYTNLTLFISSIVSKSFIFTITSEMV